MEKEIDIKTSAQVIVRIDLKTRREARLNAAPKTRGSLPLVKGDLGFLTPVARNNLEVNELIMQLNNSDKGDLYRFTLVKGSRAHVGNVGLELVDADSRQGRFTLRILVDNRYYLKKDRLTNEPIQFYAGNDGTPCVVVVNSIDDVDQVTGYFTSGDAFYNQ